jgi:hypothetical protein
MSGKRHDSLTHIDPNEADDLRLAVRELNQSVAHLSKIILQLQRSINSTPTTVQEKPGTIH